MTYNPRELSLPTQLLLKQIEVIEGDNLLVIGAFEKEIAEELKKHLPSSNLTFFNFEYHKHLNLLNQAEKRVELVFGSWYNSKHKHDSVLLYLPKSEALIEMSLAMINLATESGAKICVVGQKTEGIKSQPSKIEECLGEIDFTESARHSTIYRCTKTKPAPTKSKLEDWFEEYEITVKDQNLKVASLPGVFSHGRLDQGTQLLLENYKPKTAKNILDWGCGSGVIGAFIQKTQPEVTLDLVDSNALALEATKRTLELNKLKVSHVRASDVFSEIQNTYDLIISNPPFHSGVKTNYSAVESFIAGAAEHLNDGGRLLIVANSFLRYQPHILKSLGNCKIISQNNGFKVYEATKTP
jgi:16S rRNA (guanine1207-N2)-methyltransferase